MILAFLMKNFKEILIFLFAIIFLNKFKDVFSNPTEEKLDSNDELPVNNSEVTLSKVQAQGIADIIYNATIVSGTDEEAIYNQFEKMQNQSDFNLVYNAFGRRQYSKFWGNVGDPISSAKHDLLFVLTNEFNQQEQGYIKEKYPQISIF